LTSFSAKADRKISFNFPPKDYKANMLWLYARGKSRQTVVTAIARELSAFIWAIDKKIQLAIL